MTYHNMRTGTNYLTRNPKMTLVIYSFADTSLSKFDGAKSLADLEKIEPDAKFSINPMNHIIMTVGENSTQIGVAKF